MTLHFRLLIVVCLTVTLVSYSSKKDEEQISIPAHDDELTAVDTAQENSIQNLPLSQLVTTPNGVVLTGLAQHRLVTLYKSVDGKPQGGYYSKSYYDDYNSEFIEHFMPGLDLIQGYNLLNVAHYDLQKEQLNLLFERPALIKSLYYPSFVQDSLYEIPVNRDYYLVSVYDADTNADTLINRHDLRRFYHFNASGNEKTQIIPSDHSVVKSQYDPKNDVMYIFAKHDENNNGIAEKTEPLHIFWIALKTPAKAKRLY